MLGNYIYHVFLNGMVNTIFYFISSKNTKNRIEKFILKQNKVNKIEYFFNYSIISPKCFILISLLNIFLFISFLKVWSLL